MRRSMVRARGPALTLTLLLAAWLPQAGAAQDDSKLERARALAEVMKVQAVAEAMTGDASLLLDSLASRANPGREAEALELVRQEILPAVRRYQADYLERVVRYYSESLSAGEIEESIAFFRTATGQKWVSNVAELALGPFQIGSEWLGDATKLAVRETRGAFEQRGLTAPAM